MECPIVTKRGRYTNPIAEKLLEPQTIIPMAIIVLLIGGKHFPEVGVRLGNAIIAFKRFLDR